MTTYWKMLNWFGIGPVPLTRAAEERLDVLFPGKERARAKDILMWLPSLCPKHPTEAERIQFALLRLSNGSISELEDWMDELRKDFRTVLCAAGFGDDVRAHESWFPKGPALDGKPGTAEIARSLPDQLKQLRELKRVVNREKRGDV